ncbi:MAG: peptidase domain-containing ABC transporter [Xanthomonadaceae bacterium]|nr:peptidase domain-containing ABC transporter [Xanthomonadaceae bacterium]
MKKSIRVPVLLQSEAAECGLACVAMVAAHHGYETDLGSLRRRWALSLKGATLGQLIAMASALGLGARALRADLEELGKLRLPAILHWNLDHFVVLERVGRRGVRIVDPAVGRSELSPDEVSARFTGVALELTPTEAFERRRDAAPLPLGAFFRRADGIGSALSRLFALSIALQVFVLAAPLFGQVVIDEVVVTGDRDLLTVLGIAFLLLTGIQVCIAGIRGRLIIEFGAALQFGWAARLFHHLLRLPLAWFERRHVGDVVSRFNSIKAVEALVAHTAVEALVDGMMAVAVLAVMLLYGWELTAVVVAALLAYATVRLFAYHALRDATRAALLLGARENSMFMESLRAILPLKSFAREALRDAAWQNRKAAAIDAEVGVRRIELGQSLANTAIFASENVIVLWVGAVAVIDGSLTVGMLVAFLAYKSQFTVRAGALIDHAVSYRLVRVHLDRIADIALSPRDPGCADGGAPVRRVAGAVSVEDLRFRYADTEPLVISGLSLNIRAGECVALVAPSGFGKTTLIKLMMGLLQPTAGSVCVDGVDLRRTPAAIRKQSAAVMQDDVLLAGSVADNIALFDPEPDEVRMQACAKLAAIHADIAAMTMGYRTLVGDMGSALSGGQRQRVLLARALYARPRILLLDEATSHLDADTERRIHAALARMRITRVLVSHRPQTLSCADRVIDLTVQSYESRQRDRPPACPSASRP